LHNGDGKGGDTIHFAKKGEEKEERVKYRDNTGGEELEKEREKGRYRTAFLPTSTPL